jgi:hypothetical protein
LHLELVQELYDPCPKWTRTGVPCGRESHHVGGCKPDDAVVEEYRVFVESIRRRAQTMKRYELERAAEFHRLAWQAYRTEYNAR